jgi:hypothetical protein
MTVKEIIETLEAETVGSNKGESVAIEMACAADLMSDVLAFAKAGALLLTGLTTVQAIYTAEMADVKAICFVRGKAPQKEAVALAQSRGIVLLKTRLPMFESCGRLYKKGLGGCSEL